MAFTAYTENNKIVPGVVLIKPDGTPYEAAFQILEGGDIDTTGLAKESKQDASNTHLAAIDTKLGAPLTAAVTAESLPLPSGAATATKQDAIITALNNEYALLGAGLEVTLSNASVPVTASSLPLPTGASTSAKQDSLLAAIEDGVDVQVTNTVPVTMANRNVTVSNAVEIANTSIPVTDAGGSLTVDGTVAATQSGAWTSTLAEGSSVVVSSIGSPVAITDNGGSITVDGDVGVSGVVQVADNGGSLTIDATSLPLPNGASTSALQTSGNASLTSIDGKTPALGQAVKAASVPVTLASDQGNTPVSVANFPATQPVSGTVTATPPAPSATASGLTPYRNQAVTNTGAAVKTTQGRVFGYHFANPNTAWSYVHFYNATTANVTVGTTVPIASFGVPANAVLDGYWNLSDTFGAAISIAATTSPLSNVATAPTNALLVQLAYV